MDGGVEFRTCRKKWCYTNEAEVVEVQRLELQLKDMGDSNRSQANRCCVQSMSMHAVTFWTEAGPLAKVAATTRKAYCGVWIQGSLNTKAASRIRRGEDSNSNTRMFIHPYQECSRFPIHGAQCAQTLPDPCRRF